MKVCSNETTPLAFSCGRPFNNPTERYRYYSLPFCHQHDHATQEKEVEQEAAVTPEENVNGGQKYEQSFGESIAGDRCETSPYKISFMDTFDWRPLCKTILYKKQLEKFKDAIRNNYFVEMFVEDLPMWSYVGDFLDEDFLMGEVRGSKTFLFPHLHFYLGYNGDQIVTAKLSTDVRT
jgi:hypothetical protein